MISGGPRKKNSWGQGVIEWLRIQKCWVNLYASKPILLTNFVEDYSQSGLTFLIFNIFEVSFEPTPPNVDPPLDMIYANENGI